MLHIMLSITEGFITKDLVSILAIHLATDLYCDIMPCPFGRESSINTTTKENKRLMQCPSQFCFATRVCFKQVQFTTLNDPMGEGVLQEKIIGEG